MKLFDAGLSIILLAAVIGWGVSYLGNRAVSGDAAPTFCARYEETLRPDGRRVLVCTPEDAGA